MAILVSKTRAQGASVVTALPAEVACRLSVTAGQELEWIEDGIGEQADESEHNGLKPPEPRRDVCGSRVVHARDQQRA